MDIQRQKQKQVPKNLKQKLNVLFQSINNEKGHWIDANTFTLLNCQQVNEKLNEVFDMSYKTFLKFIQMVGCKVRRQGFIKQENEQEQIYRISLPMQQYSGSQKNLLKSLMQNTGPLNLNNSAINNFQCSIQASIQKPQHELFNLQNQMQFKDIFIKNFKTNVDSTNQFISSAFYRILASRESKKMSPCQIMQILTELRDRLFENQKQIEDCMNNFKLRIKSFGNQLPYAQNQNGNKQNKQMESEMDIQDYQKSR